MSVPRDLVICALIREGEGSRETSNLVDVATDIEVDAALPGNQDGIKALCVMPRMRPVETHRRRRCVLMERTTASRGARAAVHVTAACWIAAVGFRQAPGTASPGY